MRKSADNDRLGGTFGVWAASLATLICPASAGAKAQIAAKALPDYLSKLVNVGIQQGGVENALPVAICQSKMERLAIFLSAEDREASLDQYSLFTRTSPEYSDYNLLYPLLVREPHSGR
jgi:hypothetical protein